MKFPGRRYNLKNIRLIMAGSYLLLIGFAVQWLYTQYRQEENNLQQELTKLFDDVQQGITDSLLLVSLIRPSVEGPEQKQEVVELSDDSIRRLSSLLFHENKEDISLQGLKMAVRRVRNLTESEKKYLFRIDTTVFNDEYVARMKNMGWNFPVKWIAATEGKTEEDHIFIPNRYLHSGYGIVIADYRSYLLGKLWAQEAFILVLLGAILMAFYTTHRSLAGQIRLGKMKDDFVSNMSHELKTPIATVKVALEAIQHFEAAGRKELTTEYMQMAGLEMERLELLVNRSLHTSLLESGRLSIQPEMQDIRPIIEEVMQAYQVKFLSYEATAHFVAKGEHFYAMADKLHLQGVLVNLLDNSLKYGREKPEILVMLEEKDNEVAVSVQDNGPGIPEAYRNRVFEKFFRVPSGNNHQIKGYGLGLSYASQVMQQHKGSISVSNISGGGCSFTLSLP